jgi:CSLREA domain-containing protein
MYAIVPLNWRPLALAVLLAGFLVIAANAPTAYGATLIVNSAADTDDGQCTASAAGCTLREALNQAQRTSVENISFHIGSGAKTIDVGSALPYINRPTTLDGTTQPGCAHYPCIELNGQNAGGDAKGLWVIAGGVPGVTTVRGLVVNRFGGGGIAINSAGLIEGNYLGTSMSGDLPRGNGRDGLEISGDTTVRNNIISGNSEGIRIAGQPTAGALGITIQGNLIGTDSSGTSPVSNDGAGIVLSNVLDSATIGGDIQAERNVISGNGGGISCESSAQTTGPLLIVGNYIGIDATGTNAPCEHRQRRADERLLSCDLARERDLR